MTKDEALKLSLEALEDLGMKHFESTGEVLYKETFTAIKEALAQPEQDNTYIYASNLAKTIWQKHYMKESPKFALLDTTEGVLTQIDNMTCGLVREKPAQPEQEPVAHSVISGALFDFMGWLTSRKERIVLSSADNASPAVEAITEFAKMRNLSLDDAKVQDWNTTPPQRKPLTDEQTIILKGTTCPEIDWKARHGVEMNNGERNQWMLDWFMAFKVAIEAAHGIKGGA